LHRQTRRLHQPIARLRKGRRPLVRSRLCRAHSAGQDASRSRGHGILRARGSSGRAPGVTPARRHRARVGLDPKHPWDFRGWAARVRPRQGLGPTNSSYWPSSL